MKLTSQHSNFITIIGFSILVIILNDQFSVIRVTGNSMNPTLKDQQLVLIYRTNKVEIDNIVIFDLDNSTFIKRVKVDCSSFDQHSPLKCKFGKNNGCCLFVGGDNIQFSDDSHNYGLISKHSIKGKLIFKIL